MKRLVIIFISLIVFAVGIIYWWGSVLSVKPLVLPLLEDESSSIASRECQFSSQFDRVVDCYWFFTEQGGFKLPVAVFRAKSALVYSDPLVFISGGPGETGSTSAEYLSLWDDWLNRVEIERDFVVMDVRGAAPGAPSLECDEYLDKSKELLQKNITFEQEYRIITPILNRCFDELNQNPSFSMSDFSSLTNAQDLGSMLTGLGYSRWNYLGVSYGTRVAIVAALTQPQVNKVILDSPYPLNRGKLSDAPPLWRSAFEHFWQLCKSDQLSDDCDLVSEDVEALFWRVMNDLKINPITITTENWFTGESVSWVLNDQRFAAAVYSSMYSSELFPLIVFAVGDLSQREELSWEGEEAASFLLESFYNQVFDPSFNSMLYFATECNDNALDSEVEFNAALQQSGRFASIFEADYQWNICQNTIFRTKQLPKMQRLNIPVLVAAGEHDPITTLDDAQSLSQWLTQGYILDLKGKSHAEFYLDECGASLIPWFLREADESLKSQWRLTSEACNN